MIPKLFIIHGVFFAALVFFAIQSNPFSRDPSSSSPLAKDAYHFMKL